MKVLIQISFSSSQEYLTIIMKDKLILIDKKKLNSMINRLAHEILESTSNYKNIVLIGIKTRGEPLSHRIKIAMESIKDLNIPVGTIDITFHRDDFSNKFIMPKLGPSEISFDLTDKEVVLVDDVIYTGRTIRAAMDEIFSFGRPKSIKLAVLVDRGHRELPIRPDFVGKNFPTDLKEHIVVKMIEIDDEDEIVKVIK